MEKEQTTTPTLKCRFGWHEWSKWEDALFIRTPTYYGIKFPERSSEFIKQVRFCLHCNKRQDED